MNNCRKNEFQAMAALSVLMILGGCGGGSGGVAPEEALGGKVDSALTDAGGGMMTHLAVDATGAAGVIGPKPFISTDIVKGTLFADPHGNGTTCSKALPCDIWAAVNKAVGGNVVFLRGGTYALSKNLQLNNTGSATAPVVFESYPGELAVFDGIEHPKGTDVLIRVTGRYINLRGIEVKNMPRQGIWIGGTDNVVDGAHVHHSALAGIQVFSPYDAFPYGAYGSRNIIRNSTVHDNSDAGLFSGEFANGGNADGISISSGADNRVENCLVYHNSDDGIDTWRSTNSYVGHNIVHSQGIADGNGNGVKAGGYSPSNGTFVERNLVYSNRATGVDFNSGASVKFSNNTTWNNSSGYALGPDTVASNNISAEAGRGGTGIATNNSWQRTGSVAFISTDPSSPNFLKPTVGGGFENIGAYAGASDSTLLPDVIVTSLSYASGNFTAVVKNQGGAATPAGVPVGVAYSVDGASKTWGDITGPLAAGASVSIGTKGGAFLIPDGSHTITAYVDDVNRFKESNDSNNQRSQTLTVGAVTSSPTPTPTPTPDGTAAPSLPDVVVTSLSYASGNFTAVVKNQGSAATPAGVAVGVGYLVDGAYKTWGDMKGPLAAGASVSIATKGGAYNIPSGTHTIMAYVDDANRFAESNKSNNQLTQALTVGSALPPLPDVVVTSLSYSGGNFTAVVKNQGTAATPAGVAVGVAYSVDGAYKTWGDMTGPLAAGASVSIGTKGGSYSIPIGTHTITAFVDDVNRFVESNESNNQLTQTLTVGSALPPLPDVVVTSLSYSGGNFTAVVKNQGTAATPAGVAVGVAYSVDGAYKTWGDMTGPLAAGASVSIGTKGGAYNIPSGTHTISAFVDDATRFTESNDSNNQLTQALTVGGTPSFTAPALINASSPEKFGAKCDGATDDTAAFQKAVDAGDILVPAGRTCVINTQVTITMSNRHIECGAGAVLKQNSSLGRMFYVRAADFTSRTSGDSIVNCHFIGQNTVAPSFDDSSSDIMSKHYNIPVMTGDRVDNFLLAGNTFERFFGQAMFQTYGSVDGGYGDKIIFNTFKSCGYYGPVFDAHANGYIANNILVDCAVGVENDNTSQITGGNVIEQNTISCQHGYGARDMDACTMLTGGATVFGDYSGNIVRNNSVVGVSDAAGFQGAGNASKVIIGTAFGNTKPAQYTSNSCSGGCVVVP